MCIFISKVFSDVLMKMDTSFVRVSYGIICSMAAEMRPTFWTAMCWPYLRTDRKVGLIRSDRNSGIDRWQPLDCM